MGIRDAGTRFGKPLFDKERESSTLTQQRVAALAQTLTWSPVAGAPILRLPIPPHHIITFFPAQVLFMRRVELAKLPPRTELRSGDSAVPRRAHERSRE